MRRLTFTAQIGGWYFVELRTASPGFGAYTLKLAKS